MMNKSEIPASAIMRSLGLVVGKWEGDDGGGEIEGCKYIPGVRPLGKKAAGGGGLSTGCKSMSNDDLEFCLAFG
jgi:hypothetical protein